jgi:hypothetical protein
MFRVLITNECQRFELRRRSVGRLGLLLLVSGRLPRLRRGNRGGGRGSNGGRRRALLQRLRENVLQVDLAHVRRGVCLLLLQRLAVLQEYHTYTAARLCARQRRQLRML